MSLNDYDMLDYLKRNLGEVVTSEKSLILYGSESGRINIWYLFILNWKIILKFIILILK